MSGPERELPPLRIKLLGDNTDFKKSVTDAKKVASDLARHVNQMSGVVGTSASTLRQATRYAVTLVSNAVEMHIRHAAQHAAAMPAQGRAQIRRATRQAITDLIALVALHVEQAASSANSMGAQGSSQVRRTMRQARDLVLHYLLISIRRMVNTSHTNMASGSGQVNRVMRQSRDLILHYLLISVRRMVSTAHSVTASGAQVRRTMRQAIDVVMQGIISSVSATIRQAAASMAGRVMYISIANRGLRAAVRDGIQAVTAAIHTTVLAGVANLRLQGLQNTINAGVNRVLRQAFGNAFNQLGANNQGGGNQNNRGGGGSRRTRGGGFGGMSLMSGGGFGGLGNRADIYMNLNSMKTMLSAGAAPLRALSEWQDMTVALEVFIGDAGKAKVMMEDLQQFALVSPYTTAELAKSTKMLMAYGSDGATALEVTKRLGDVSGGSAEKMGQLSLAMGQVISMGKLQGQELRQLTEHAFNPLKTISEKTGMALADVKEAMSDGLVTSDMVIAALRTETSEGGNFFGLMNRLSKTISGLSNQLREYGELISRKVLETMTNDIVHFLQIGVYYVKMLSDWVAGHKEAVRSIAMLTVKILAVVFAAKAFALMLALVRWNLHTLITVALAVVSPIVGVVRGFAALSYAVYGVVTALWAMWAAVFGPWAVILAGAVALVVALDLVVLTLRNKDGMLGAIRDVSAGFVAFFTAIPGFLANFSHNMTVLMNWFRDNWGNMLIDIGRMFLALFTNLPHNMVMVWEGVLRVSVIAFSTLTEMLLDMLKDAFELKMPAYFAKGALSILQQAKDLALALTNPSGHYATLAMNGFIAAAGLADRVSGDVGKSRIDGFGAAALAIAQEQAGKMKMPWTGIDFATKPIEGLKFDGALSLPGLGNLGDMLNMDELLKKLGLPTVPNAEELKKLTDGAMASLPKDDTDWNAILSKLKGGTEDDKKKSKVRKAVADGFDASTKGSMLAAKRADAYAAYLQDQKGSASRAQDPQKTMVDLLRVIAKNTKPSPVGTGTVLRDVELE